MEAQLGVRLLRRSTHGLSLTPEGAQVVARGREMLLRLDELVDAATSSRRAVAGPVRLAVSAAMADELVVPMLPELMRRHPALRIELVADDRLADLPTEGFDVALRSAIGPSEQVVARPLGDFSRALYASPAYLQLHGTPANPDDLHRHLTITNTRLGDINRWCFRVDGKVVERAFGGTASANSTWLVQRMISAGLGIGWVSMPLAARSVAAGELVEVLPRFRDPRKLTLYAVCLPHRRRLPRLRAVVDHLESMAATCWSGFIRG